MKSYTYIFERLILWIIRNSWVIKTNELAVTNHVVLFPGYNVIFVSVEVRESLFCIIQSIFSVHVLNPCSQLLCKENKAD